jgi:hypothetical protein
VGSQLRGEWSLRSPTSKLGKECPRRRLVVECRPTKEATTDQSQVVIEKRRTHDIDAIETMDVEMMIDTSEALHTAILPQCLRPSHNSHIQYLHSPVACRCSLLGSSSQARTHSHRLQVIVLETYLLQLLPNWLRFLHHGMCSVI